MYTHTLDLQTNTTALEAEIQFNGDEKPHWKSTSVELSLEETSMVNSVINCLNELHHKCGGLIKFEVNLK